MSECCNHDCNQGRDCPRRKAAKPAQSLALQAALGYVERHTPNLVYTEIAKALAAPQPAPQIFLADVRKVRDALDPDDWCGDERMIDVLDRALAEKPCCANRAAGTSCFADPRPSCPMLTTPQAPQRQPLTDEQIDAGARVLCRRCSEACGTNEDDEWAINSEHFKDEARAVLVAAQGITEAAQ